jgi:hypothetical protein
MGSLVRAQEGERWVKEVRNDLFFCFYPLYFRLNKDFCSSIPGEGLVVFRPFSQWSIFEIFVLCQECAKSCIGLRKTVIFFSKNFKEAEKRVSIPYNFKER